MDNYEQAKRTLIAQIIQLDDDLPDQEWILAVNDYIDQFAEQTKEKPKRRKRNIDLLDETLQPSKPLQKSEPLQRSEPLQQSAPLHQGPVHNLLKRQMQKRLKERVEAGEVLEETIARPGAAPNMDLKREASLMKQQEELAAIDLDD